MSLNIVYKANMKVAILRMFAVFAVVMSSVILSDLVIVPREGWHAKPPKSIENMMNPVKYVVIHHSYQPAACYTQEDCMAAMQWMQDLHQINNSWVDIGYSFAAGGDGLVYEGRGWSRVGAHAPSYNNISIGICLIGDWRVELPPAQQLAAVKQLIQFGISQGKIMEDYRLVGHRQVREGTECPGDRLFEEIQTWPHFYEVPEGDKYHLSGITSNKITRQVGS